MRNFLSVSCILLMFLLLQGCGETVRGMGKDIARIGRGIKTVFVSDYH